MPTIADFDRLDERFRFQGDVWEKLPQYRRHGFAVFKLTKGAQKVHPMAFEFPRANPRQLFFPTVHIHDGDVHDLADFDHNLFCQVPNDDVMAVMSWRESRNQARDFMNLGQCQGLIDGQGHVYSMLLKYMLKNRDWAVG